MTYTLFRGFGGPVWGAFGAYYGPLMALLGFLGASAFYNGVVNALFWLGFILTQIPAAYFSERMQYKKRAMGVIFILAGFPMFIFGIILLITGGGNVSFILGTFLVCYAFTTIISGSATPFIFTLLAKIIPSHKLGSWLGIYFLTTSFGGLLGGIVVRKILTRGYPEAFVITSIGSFVFMIIIAALVWLIDEPAGKLAPRKDTFGVYLKHIITIIKEDRNLVRFFVGMWIVVGHYIVVTFYTRYATTGGFGIDKAQAGLFVTMNLLGYILASLGPLAPLLLPLNWLLKLHGHNHLFIHNIFSAGWIADRFGPKFTLVTFQLAALCGVVIALFSHRLSHFCIVWIFAGFAQICNNIGYTNMTLQSCPIDDKSSYVGLVNFAVFPFVVVVPMIFGALCDRGIISFTGTFKISLVFMIISALYFVIIVDNPVGFKKLKAERK